MIVSGNQTLELDVLDPNFRDQAKRGLVALVGKPVRADRRDREIDERLFTANASGRCVARRGVVRQQKRQRGGADSPKKRAT